MMTTHPNFRRAGVGVLALSALVSLHNPAAAQTDAAAASPHDAGWRATILDENDSLYFNSDKHYTQGFRISFLSPPLQADGWTDDVFQWVGHIPAVFVDPGKTTSPVHRRISWFFGQSIFTPKNLDIKPPDARDRPYAGWLYAGPSLLQETGNQLENLELDLGVVGPPALGRQVQNDWHQFIGIHQAQGWSNQLQNEPGAVLAYDRYWRIGAPSFLHWEHGGVQDGVDVVPEAGATVGNIFDYAEAGAQLRIGHHLETDYGPIRVRPSLSGTDYFNGEHLGDDVGWYLFAGVQGRAVAHNVFLDGNNFRTSAHVEHKTFVADLQAGAAAYWSDRVRLDLSVMRRTPEFVGQHAPDVLGTAAVSFSW